MRWYWWIPIMIIVVAVKATIYFAGQQVWAYLTTPEERAACFSGGYADELVIAGCTKMVESGAYDDKDVAVAYYNRAHTLFRQGRHADALSDYSQALALNPRYLAALNNRAHTLQRLGRYKDSIADLDKAIAIWPDFRLAILNRAIAFRNIGKFEQALADAERAIALDGSDIGAHRERGLIKEQLDDRGEAILAFGRAIEIDPRDFASYFHRGRLYFGANQFDKAIADLSIAHDLAPHDQHTLALRAHSFERSGKSGAAIADFRRVLKINPGNAEAQMGLARLGVTDGKSDEQYCTGPYQVEERMRACTRAIESGKLPPERVVKALLARAVIQLHFFDRAGEAADDVDRAAALAPNDPRIADMRGMIALRTKSYNRALATYEAMLKATPESLSARLGRAHALLGLKRYREALAEFDWALARSPDNPHIHLARGQAYEGLGQRAAAIRDYRTAYRRGPSLTDARRGLARLGEEP